ncbi:L,D-transpeptidase [Alkalihalobacterium elongatum]|uniref:L,D-transpeptidase n=1 Tax=Alkalihalobacterium elongatum TaxID=2675466 RepID=UPI001C1FC7EA|nr:L,D-transpeptidase [Alkalihalobacterium elongatum]
MLKTLLLSIMLVVSPIWPLGDNPLIGDPFLIVNKQNNQLAYIHDGAIQNVYPVATGKETELTPEGEFMIVVKAPNPYYRKKDIQGGAKDNPLGTRWIGFDALDTDGRIYGVHGTNAPQSIGNYVTAGCVRMDNTSVEKLYEEIPLGTKILIVNTAESFEDLARKAGAIE